MTGVFQADCSRQVEVPSKGCWKGHSGSFALRQNGLQGFCYCKASYDKRKTLQGSGLCGDSSRVPPVIALFLLIYCLYGLVILRFLQTVN